jgi:energy-converting hydrogenase Eha subunit G
MTIPITSRKKGGRFRDFLLYCAIGVLVALAAMFLGVHQAKTGESAVEVDKWIGFALMTAFVFGYAIRHFRSVLRQPKFWLLLLVLAAAHCGLGLIILSRVAAMSLINFAVASVFECYALNTCIEWLLPSHRQPHQNAR